MSTDRPNIQGEGDYESGKRYDEATKRFVEQGKVGPAAEKARTDDPAELADLERSEREGRERARGEDPQLRRGTGGQPGGKSGGKPGGS